MPVSGRSRAQRRPRLLDLFCGAGGASVGYHRAGFEVVGVDHRRQPHYPYAFHLGDALEVAAWLANGDHDYDAVHASPPCQAHSRATSRNRRFTERERREPMLVPRHLDLIDPIRALLDKTPLPYVIENVEGAPLRSPVLLCGSSFGLDVRRHRLFEARGFHLSGLPCEHHRQTPRFPPNDSRRPGRLASVITVGGHLTYPGEWELWQRAMGIEWMTTPGELGQAIPPAYTEHIGGYLIAELEARCAA